VVGDGLIDTKIFLVTNFINLKIKLPQSFECAHRNIVCVCACINRHNYSYMFEYLRLYCLSLKNGSLNKNWKCSKNNLDMKSY
jgi:hypothetical protein